MPMSASLRSARATAAQEPSAALACHVAGSIRDRPIHQHAIDTDGKCLRLLERRDVLDGGCVEHNEVGVRALADFAAILELEIARGEAAHLVHGGLERKQPQVAAVMAEHAGEGSP